MRPAPSPDSIIVLATAYVIKEHILEAVEVRHANEQAFQTALADWQVVTAAPEGNSQPDDD